MASNVVDVSALSEFLTKDRKDYGKIFGLKMADGFAAKLEARNRTWLAMLRVVGKIRQSAGYAAAMATEEDEVEFILYQDRLLPIGRIANAQVQGWLLDVTIPLNGYLCPEDV